MADIVEYIEENFKKPLTLRDISVHLGYDYCYLSKSFNCLFSMPFNDYINTIRIDCATELLSSTAMSITEIAMESGFQSIRSFNNVFQKKIGMTPAEFRKKGL
jgi:YesN/AraC family two-component response regulator